MLEPVKIFRSLARLAVAGLCCALAACSDSPQPAAPAARTPAQPAEAVRSAASATQTLETPPAPLSAPLLGFFEKSPEDQGHVIALFQNAYELPADDIAFLKSAIRRPELSPVTRNNMANILVQQDRKDAQLYRLFLGMLQDETETPLWRDDALQHLATTIGFAADPAASTLKQNQPRPVDR